MKKKTKVIVRNNIRYELDGDINNVIKTLQQLRAEAEADELEDVKIDIDVYEEYGNAVCTAEVYGFLLETDAEEAARVKKEQEAFDKQLVWKRQQLAALKKELGEV